MKKNLLILASLVFAFIACEPEIDRSQDKNTYIADFEDVQLDTTGVWNGSDLSGDSVREVLYGDTVDSYYGYFRSSQLCKFHNVYTSQYNSYKGAACSNHIDNTTGGYENQYSAAAGKGANGSKQYALLFDDGASFSINYPQGYSVSTLKSVMVCNGTYGYIEMRDGGFGKKFEAGDWFKVTFKGTKKGLPTDSVTYYLADFRDGKSFINHEWELLDLTALGDADKVAVYFDSSDKGPYGVNTPKYVFIDDLILYQQR